MPEICDELGSSRPKALIMTTQRLTNQQDWMIFFEGLRSAIFALNICCSVSGGFAFSLELFLFAVVRLFLVVFVWRDLFVLDAALAFFLLLVVFFLLPRLDFLATALFISVGAGRFEDIAVVP